ncbi:MAG: glycosyltransferase family 4 protein, partial [Acidobacteria bacterium]|nr:glycosyltransferase family 4 protein [Acidobacteriota bacterium]
MRILYLTGGAGQMYCGSCLRDNALAAELLSRGHDVTLIPVYTPTLTDEPNVSQEKVFFGGISVYLQQYLPLFRKSPRWLDRLWDSKAMLHRASRRSISTNPKMLGELTVSMLKGEDLFLEGLEERYKSESLSLIRANIKHVDAFISVSEYYAEFVPEYLNIPPEKIRVVPLGINLQGYEKRERESSQPFTVGFFARVAPEKGLHVLAEAYRHLRADGRIPEARLEVAGYMAPEHKSYLSEIEQAMKDAGLGAEFNYHGVLDREEKISFLRTLDVLSVPATYNEPKGIFLLEAMACGVPVVQPRRGAFTEIVEKTGG